MAESNYTCVYCTVSFFADRKRKYCTKKCSADAKHRRNHPRTWDQYISDVSVREKSTFTCEHCGKEHYRRLGGSSVRNGYANRWCSNACKAEQLSVERAARKQIQGEVKALLRIGRNIRREKARIERAAQAVVKPPKPARRISCAKCGIVFATHNGHTRYCSGECRIAVDRERNRLFKQTEAGRRAKRQYRASRRAIERGAKADNIDPIKVFEMYKWRCHLCGDKTPKHLRGTYDDKAPELEHIVSLADGGSHTWGNVACACRRCNAAKGALSAGQTGFSFAV